MENREKGMSMAASKIAKTTFFVKMTLFVLFGKVVKTAFLAESGRETGRVATLPQKSEKND